MSRAERDSGRRYTKAAMRSMQLGNQLTMRFNHEYFASEHLLGGLLAEESGSAAAVLRGVGADPVRIKDEVIKRLVPGKDMVTCARVPRTPCLLRAIESAGVEADGLGHPEVDTRHLLIGLASSGGVAAEVLRQGGVVADALRGCVAVRTMAGSGNSAPAPGGNGLGL